MVDCENCDPFKLNATLRNLNENRTVSNQENHSLRRYTYIQRLAIFDRFTSIPVEREDVARITNRKSLVDIRMTAGTCREYYQDRISAFIIASSIQIIGA
jgi:hypothetical protein